MSVLLVASKKSITRKWLKQECPSLTEWMDITMDIYNMEMMTALVNRTVEKFVSYWEKWVNYVKPLRSDFTFII